MAPFYGRAQRLVPGESGAAATGKEAEAIVQPGGNLLYRQPLHPGCRQLDGQRNAIQASADLGYSRSVLLGQREIGLGSARPLDKELDSLVFRQLAGRWQVLRVGQREGRH